MENPPADRSPIYPQNPGKALGLPGVIREVPPGKQVPTLTNEGCQFESDLNHKLLPEPERLLPVLQKIADDPRVVEIARQRARALVERLRLSASH